MRAPVGVNGERPGPQEGVAGAAGGPGPRRSQPAAASAVADCGHPLLLLLFLFLLFVPGTFSAGPLQLSLYKIFLLLATIPLGILWIRGAAGRIVPADILILAFAGFEICDDLINRLAEDLLARDDLAQLLVQRLNVDHLAHLFAGDIGVDGKVRVASQHVLVGS